MNRTRCPHCRGKLEQGQRIHAECIAPWADAQAEKAKRAEDLRKAIHCIQLLAEHEGVTL